MLRTSGGGGSLHVLPRGGVATIRRERAQGDAHGRRRTPHKPPRRPDGWHPAPHDTCVRPAGGRHRAGGTRAVTQGRLSARESGKYGPSLRKRSLPTDGFSMSLSDPGSTDDLADALDFCLRAGALQHQAEQADDRHEQLALLVEAELMRRCSAEALKLSARRRA